MGAPTCKLQIRREPAVGEAWGKLEIRMNGESMFELEPGQLKAVYWEPEPVKIAVVGKSGAVFEQVVQLPAESIFLLSLNEEKPGLLGRIVGQSPRLSLNEVSRQYLAPYDPGPVRMLRNQFWIGVADSDQTFSALMAERDDYYSEENEEAEGTDRHFGLSAFADVMGKSFYDHDVMECGFAKPGESLEERFAGHSWVAQWAPVLREMIDVNELRTVNVFVMSGIEEGGYKQFGSPRDVDLPGIKLRYIGELVHPSH